MAFNMNYETELPLEFCGRLATYVPCLVELECNTDGGTAEYKVISIRLSDYNGDYYEPAGEDFDMICRMLRTYADKHLVQSIWDKADWEDTVIRGNKDWGIYS